MSKISESALAELFLNDTPFIDVRAPIEFEEGSLPGAINLPIMYNDERSLVGTTYKLAGKEDAIALGHELVSGDVKSLRLRMWTEQIRRNPETILYCFRGGLRSQITQSWLKEAGINAPLIEGGYKKARQFLRDQIESFSAQHEFIMLTGPTGSAKTKLIQQALSFYPGVDLESLAQHRGSAFGGGEFPQPSQIDFENRLAVALLKVSPRLQGLRPLFEDESRLIGRCALPVSLFERMRASRVIFVEESFEARVEHIFADYVLSTPIGHGEVEAALTVFTRYRRALETISKKLGGLRTQEVLQDMRSAEEAFLHHRDLQANKVWIAKLLSYYYDPLYARSLERRDVTIEFRGSTAEVLNYLRNLRA